MNNKDLIYMQAVESLMMELEKGDMSVHSDADWISEGEIIAEFVLLNML